MLGEEGLADMSVQPKNPITMSYQSHDSPIYSTSFSPFNRHLFLTSAHDGQIRIISLFGNRVIYLAKFWTLFCTSTRRNLYLPLVTITASGFSSWK
jgi:WD40 repeat protein